MNERCFVRQTVPTAECAETARKEILESVFRPRDIGTAEIEPPTLVQLPIWRVEVSSSAKTISLMGYVGPVPIPRTSVRHKEGAALVCARRSYPFDPTPKLVGVRTIGKDVLEIPSTDVERLARDLDGEMIEPDLSREDAERIARQRMETSNTLPSQAMVADHDTIVRGAELVFYPLVVVRYCYDGAARRYREENLFVAVSARTGKIVASEHPSALRSVTHRLRTLFG